MYISCDNRYIPAQGSHSLRARLDDIVHQAFIETAGAK